MNYWNNSSQLQNLPCEGKGKKISGYYSIKDDINNSGATYVDKPVVVSDNIVSSPHYDHMGIWMKTAIGHAKKWQ